MKFTIDWLENKAEDWKLVSLVGEDKVNYKDVSINRKSKKGEIFPNFDTLASGGEVEGELWTSPAGKHYLFPPRPQKAPNAGFKQKLVEETMARKESSIRGFQASKEESIKLMSAQRDAVLLVTTFAPKEATEEELKHTIIKWRDWLLLSHEFNDVPPFE